MIGNNVCINENTRIGAKLLVDIGPDSLIGDEVSIHDFDGHPVDGVDEPKPVIIGQHVWIGERVTILKGVTVGCNVIIGAGSVVTDDLPDNGIYAGNPARLIKKFNYWEF
ncbi:MAG: acyltransferase [Eubacteriales bacterium]|nr:acyltransferase [Eubacteriales bacterium]